TPAPVFGASALTGNVTLGAVFNANNPAAMTPPTSWTEQNDTGYNTPTTGQEYVSRDSGFTGTTITWGNASGSAFSAITVELDTTSTPAAPATPTLVQAVSGSNTKGSANGSISNGGTFNLPLPNATLSGNTLICGITMDDTGPPTTSMQ